MLLGVPEEGGYFGIQLTGRSQTEQFGVTSPALKFFRWA